MNPPPEILPSLPDDLHLRPPAPPPPPPDPQPAPRRLWVHVALFGATFVSALYAQLPSVPGETLWDVVLTPWHDPERLSTALPFAVTLMAILLAHEMGHYITARFYGVDQSLPYFIPAPTIFGTLGAVIFMRSQPPDRRALLHVAVMGPYAGLVLAIPAAAWGLAHSIPVDPRIVTAGLEFGDSFLFRGLEHFFSPNGTDVVLHPVAMAGWVGLFITSLNLIPAAQLDGGHVAYALFGKHQERISLSVVLGLLFFGIHSACLDNDNDGQGGAMWILWAILLFWIGIRHPPVQNEATPLRWQHRLNGIVALVIFVLTFIPVPVRMLHSSLETRGDEGYDDAPQLDAPIPYGPSHSPDGKNDRDDHEDDGDRQPDGRPAEEFKL